TSCVAIAEAPTAETPTVTSALTSAVAPFTVNAKLYPQSLGAYKTERGRAVGNRAVGCVKERKAKVVCAQDLNFLEEEARAVCRRKLPKDEHITLDSRTHNILGCNSGGTDSRNAHAQFLHNHCSIINSKHFS